MTYTPKDLHDLSQSIQRDLTTAKAKLAELERAVASFGLKEPAKYTCTKCPGGLQLPSQQHLNDHMELVHERTP